VGHWRLTLCIIAIALATLPAFPVEFASRILRLKPDDQELLKWARDRKSDREITAQTRIAAQDELLPRERRKEMVDETEFWQLLKNQVLKILGNAERRREFLENVLGETFRFRHADSVAAINNAIANGKINPSRYDIAHLSEDLHGVTSMPDVLDYMLHAANDAINFGA